MKMKTFLLGLLVLSSSSLSALCLNSNIELSVGYRQDDSTLGISFPEADDSDIIVKDDLSLKQINVWQAGARFRLFMPNLDCYCSCGDNFGFLRNFYLKGYGYYGTNTGNPRFKESFDDSDDNHGIEFGKIRDYTTYDWQIGLGYLIDLSCFFNCPIDLGLGILGGYSWNKHKYKIGESAFIGRDGEPIFPDVEYDGTKLSHRWKGGWIGAELYYSTCDILFNLGYEYHWSNWEGAFTPTELGSEAGFTTDKRKSDHAHGNVVYLDATYFLCDCWDIGVGFKYAYFTADDGKVTETPAPELPSFDGRGTWQTWQVTANVGYNF